jgi:formamidopyrimidine-DNA glycosylase
MPELPDVEALRKRARKVLHKKVEHVRIEQNRTIKVSPATLRRHLKGNEFVGTDRHGKYLFLEIDDGYRLVLHFGMTGLLSLYRGEDPEHSPLILDLDDGSSFAYVNVRKLGRIAITDDPEKFRKENGLGPDALSVPKREFVRRMSGRRGCIKSALMNQTIVAGIGNVYADEILYQAGLHPKATVPREEKRLARLYTVIRRVLKTAIRHDADPDTFPRRYLMRNRREGSTCSICGGTIKRDTVAGRTSYWCGKHQRKR